MTRPYGEMPRHGRKPPAAPAPAEIQINLTERHTLDQLLLELQRAVAVLQDHGVIGVEKFRMRLLPLDETAAPMALLDDEGQQILTINIPEKPADKPYRDEPGVGVPMPGVSPSGPGSSRAAPRTALRPSGNDPSRK